MPAHLIVLLVELHAAPPCSTGWLIRKTSGMNPAPPSHAPVQLLLLGTSQVPVQLMGQGLVLLHACVQAQKGAIMAPMKDAMMACLCQATIQ